MEGTVASLPPQGGRKHPNQEYIQVDTRNILFICGGAFAGLSKVIEQREAQYSVGFGATIVKKGDKKTGELLSKVQPPDLLRYGLIPEFIGRLPMVVTLEDLDEKALIAILTQPKNAIIKQYQALFDMENVELTFTPEALTAIAKKAMERETGARGLRAIIENLLLDLMFKIPSESGITQVIINETVIEKDEAPVLVYDKNEKTA